MAERTTSFRVGKVRAYRRGKVWYLCYFEAGKRRRPRVGHNRTMAQQMAAQINGQLEVGAPTALSFEPVSIPELRRRWLDHHEHLRRSSLQTIRRYRAATDHLLNFTRDVCPVRHVADFRVRQAQEFVRYLRVIEVAPNGHPHSQKRRLRDAGLKYILETCSTLFSYAQRNRHLPPYGENPFRAIEVGRVPIEDAKPIVVFTVEQERSFLEACDEWQLPLFLTLLMTGLRPGELAHLLLPQDLDLDSGWLHVRNKPHLGWQVKTRNERSVPLASCLLEVLRAAIGDRQRGPVFRQRQYQGGNVPTLGRLSAPELLLEASLRIRNREILASRALSRDDRMQVMRTIWRDTGAIRIDTIRTEFMDITSRIGLLEVTAPKTLRHTFATILQDANVDPLVRNELMGHAPGASMGPMGGLGMTAVYTHTRPETKRQQLERAFAARASLKAVEGRLQGTRMEGLTG